MSDDSPFFGVATGITFAAVFTVTVALIHWAFGHSQEQLDFLNNVNEKATPKKERGR